MVRVFSLKNLSGLRQNVSEVCSGRAALAQRSGPQESLCCRLSGRRSVVVDITPPHTHTKIYRSLDADNPTLAADGLQNVSQCGKNETCLCSLRVLCHSLFFLIFPENGLDVHFNYFSEM